MHHHFLQIRIDTMPTLNHTDQTEIHSKVILPKMTPKIILYRNFPPTPNHTWSPFVNKLETRLRLSSVHYTTAPGSLSQSPNSKIPYISYQSSPTSTPELLSDSTLITHRLVFDSVLPDLNAHLSPVEKALDLSIRSLLEDKLQFFNTREQWVDNYYPMREGILGSGGAGLPWVMQWLIGGKIYKDIIRTLYGQGTGRYSPKEVRVLKEEIWESVNAFLVEGRNKTLAARRQGGEEMKGGGEPFWILGGNGPTEADCTVYGMVVGRLMCSTAASETGRLVRSYSVLVDYARRIHGRYFSNYDLWEEEI
ncbi:putative glutathione S-transferase [Triangularia setosa]|uniref:Glutathione S-transferase n=1 Tax=Triangularia setosa TaxID=2587417 RepID=A0AAN6WGE0_9PEZI|nr:putative glutathione S-transferase [Podospora setosa]